MLIITPLLLTALGYWSKELANQIAFITGKVTPLGVKNEGSVGGEINYCSFCSHFCAIKFSSVCVFEHVENSFG